MLSGFKVSSITSSKTSGTLDGQGRTILEDGTLITTPLKGTWKRNGGLMKFYFTDAINNGAMNFVMWDVKLLEKKAEVKYFEITRFGELNNRYVFSLLLRFSCISYNGQ